MVRFNEVSKQLVDESFSEPNSWPGVDKNVVEGYLNRLGHIDLSKAGAHFAILVPPYETRSGVGNFKSNQIDTKTTSPQIKSNHGFDLRVVKSNRITI